MTQQYQQPNINENGGTSAATNTVAEPNVTLAGAGDQTLILDATAAPAQVNLPLAGEAGANAKVTIIKADAANTLTVAVQGSDALKEAAGIANPILAASQWGSLTYVSNGVDTWVAINSQA
ncbi:MAG: hypothetical protein ACYTBS_09475 [Planctomycetota bacterium]|jgi:hypothetical protein